MIVGSLAPRHFGGRQARRRHGDPSFD